MYLQTTPLKLISMGECLFHFLPGFALLFRETDGLEILSVDSFVLAFELCS